MRAPEMGTPGVAATTGRARVESTEAEIMRDQAGKLKALLLDRAARAGVSVFEAGSGGFVVRGMQHEVPDLRTLHRCLGAMGALQ